MSSAQWLYPSLALFFLPYYLDQRFPLALTNHKTQISQRTQCWKCCGNEVIVWRGMVSTSQRILGQMLDNVGNIWPVTVATLSQHSKQILCQCCHCFTQHWLNIWQILWVFYPIFTYVLGRSSGRSSSARRKRQRFWNQRCWWTHRSC